ncbi:MAG: DUF1640 domain-containing protein [Magnetococcales bacterium]|nr:DUF1640 domain-containing protein [Magnetococcales bacterium]
MHSAIAFDSYNYVRKLRDVGVDERQAAIQAEAMLDLVEERLATKKDLAEQDIRLAAIEADLKRDIKEVEAGLKRDIKELDVKLASVEAGLKRDIKELEVKMDTKAESIKAELKRDIKELDVKMAAVETNLKRDIKELDGKIELSKAELSKAIESSKGDTIKWTAGMFVAQTALIIGAMFAGVKMNQPPVYQAPPTQEMRLPAPVPAPTNPLVPAK